MCEGKTDNVYLLHAIRSLAEFYPKLATVDANKKITLNVRILKTVQTSTGRVLQLDGGASFLEAFIEQYLVELKKFAGLARSRLSLSSWTTIKAAKTSTIRSESLQRRRR